MQVVGKEGIYQLFGMHRFVTIIYKHVGRQLYHGTCVGCNQLSLQNICQRAAKFGSGHFTNKYRWKGVRSHDSLFINAIARTLCTQEGKSPEVPPVTSNHDNSENEDDTGTTNKEKLDAQHVVMLRGLPVGATAEDVVHFLDGCQVVGGTKGVHFLSWAKGRQTGFAYIELESEADVEMALRQDEACMGHRYIEVFRSNREKMKAELKLASIKNANKDGVVKLIKLPPGCTEEEIRQFFSGFEIIHNGILILPEEKVGHRGLAFVQFASQDLAERAIEREKGMIKNRLVRIIPSSSREARISVTRFGDGWHKFEGAFDIGTGMKSQNQMFQSQTGHWVRMWGIPFHVKEQDIRDFFSPLNPVQVYIHYLDDGRASGRAYVDFATFEETQKAMTKDREYLQNRWIELSISQLRHGRRSTAREPRS